MSVFQDTEEALVMNLRDSQVLNHKENLDWNWNLIGTILKVSLKRAWYYFYEIVWEKKVSISHVSFDFLILTPYYIP